MFRNSPILVLSQNAKRENGRKIQLDNVNSAKSVGDVIRTCLGPRAMLKMLMDPMGGIVMTNDGNAILREITVEHPAAKNLIEVARTQQEEVGDGTTSVIILTGELMAASEPFLIKQIHPSTIIQCYSKALTDILKLLSDKYSQKIDQTNDQEMFLKVIGRSLGTKFLNQWNQKICKIALNAVNMVTDDENNRREIDVKRNVRIEKIPGGDIADSQLLDGILLNKDITHSGMKRRIENPRILLLDCALEYKKGESQTNIEISDEGHFKRLLEMEEEYVRQLCANIIAAKVDLVFTEKGVSDLAQHFLVKAGITAIRRVKKTDNNRLSRATGATIINRTDEIKEEDIGTKCGLFEIKKIGDEYFTFVHKCKEPKACTIILRGPSKDIINEAERNLQDAIQTARNLCLDPRLVLGGGCLEMNLFRELEKIGGELPPNLQGPYFAAANALRVIPRTLAMNAGVNVIQTLTRLYDEQSKNGKISYGIDGESGELVDVKAAELFDPVVVKQQAFKSAFETSIMLLRIDDIVSGLRKNKDKQPDARPTEESMKE